VKTINLLLPANWKAMNEKQLLFYSFLISSGNSEAELRVKCFCRFSGISVDRTTIAGTWVCRKKKVGTFLLADWEVTDFLKHLDFLTDSIKEITPLTKIARRKHVDSRLRSTPFRQYLACENYYQAFIHTQDEHFLRCLAACFYNGSRAFSDNETAKRAVRFKKTSPHVLYTVFMWFTGLKDVFSIQFPNFFDRIPAPHGRPSINMREQINGMLRALHGGDITKLQAVQDTETWQALAELDAKAREAKEMEALMSKNT
jgi:hypothetical protein